ncbi:MAG: methionyl-tRNA formyltransferase [bacterium]|nr:methionyl-tRNA formyltransferase [bacterium]
MIQKSKRSTLNPKPLNFVFFGTDEFSVIVLDELKKAGFISALVVTAPDRPKGRGLKLTPPPVKIWAQENNIEFLQPDTLVNFQFPIFNFQYDLFIVASYGKILTKEILSIPKHGTLNVHPSLLPLFRGPSPIHSSILENTRMVGVTIMLMDEKIDHGPIVAQEALQFSIFNFQFSKLRDALAHEGGKLLTETIHGWLAGNIAPQEQDHAKATYTKIIKKEDGLVDIKKESPEMLYRKFKAYKLWPGIYFLRSNLGAVKGPTLKRIKITDAELKDGKFLIKKIIPEGSHEMRYSDFKR